MFHELADKVRNVQQSLQVNTGLNAHLAQHVDEVLGSDIACRPRSEGAAAESTDRRIEGTDTSIEGRHDVGKPKSTRIVEMCADLEVGVSMADPREGLEDLLRVGNSDRVAERHFVDASSYHALHDPEHPLDVRHTIK